MNRRELIAGLITASIAHKLDAVGVRTASSSVFEANKPNLLKVMLDGPFALVLQKDYYYAIRAFVPRGDNHQFYLQRDKKNGNGFHLSLLRDGLQYYQSIDPADPNQVDPKFAEFNVKASQWLLQDYYVSIDLPCPKQITYSGETCAIFRSSNKKITLPLSHILYYEITDPGKIVLRSNELGDFMPEPISGSDDLQFRLQVGLPKGPHGEDPDKDGEKARRFYNKFVLGCFPDVRNKKLKKICPPQTGTDVECKNSGLIVSFP